MATDTLSFLSQCRYVVGMDLSMTSPGVCCFDRVDKISHFIYYGQLVRHHTYPENDVTRYESKEVLQPLEGSKDKSATSSTLKKKKLTKAQQNRAPLIFTSSDVKTVEFHRLRYPKDYTNDSERFWKLANSLVATINGVIEEKERPKTLVYIEDYAYGAESNRIFQMGECAGIIKALMVHSKYRLEVISNSAAKVDFAGHGGATKRQMWNACDRMYPFITDRIMRQFIHEPIMQDIKKQKEAPKNKFYLVEALFTSSTTTKTTKKRKREKDDDDEDTPKPSKRKSSQLENVCEQTEDMPCPIQDIIDSWAICVVGVSRHVRDSRLSI